MFGYLYYSLLPLQVVTSLERPVVHRWEAQTLDRACMPNSTVIWWWGGRSWGCCSRCLVNSTEQKGTWLHGIFLQRVAVHWVQLTLTWTCGDKGLNPDSGLQVNCKLIEVPTLTLTPTESVSLGISWVQEPQASQLPSGLEMQASSWHLGVFSFIVIYVTISHIGSKSLRARDLRWRCPHRTQGQAFWGSFF